MNTADVVIVGGGFAGAATAFHLARRGAGKIVLLEREAIPGKHASGRNAALGFTSIDEPEVAALAREGLAFIRGEASELAGHVIFRPSGSLLVASAHETAARLRAQAEAQRDQGLAWWSADEIVAAVPVLRDARLLGGVWSAGDGVVDIHALLQVYLHGARAAGAVVRYRAAVTAVDCHGERVVAVHSTNESWSCGALVNAAGAWAGQVARLVGTRSFELEPRRRHLFLGRPRAAVDQHWPFVWHADVDTYFRPEADALLLSPCDATPHPPVEPVTDEEAKLLLAEKLAAAFPQLADVNIVSGWACLRTFTPDEQFVIGPDPEVAGLFWVAGLGGHGMTTSYAVGRLAAAAVLGENAGELAHFSPCRFLERRDGSVTSAAFRQ